SWHTGTMSASPAFKTVIFFDVDQVRVFQPNKKSWQEVKGDFRLDSPPDSDLVQQLGDSAVLAVVSDQFCGHLQIILPNKKDQYSDDHIGEILQKEHHIDLSAYEFASQRFPMSRSEVQVSISGIEKEVYDQVKNWLSALSGKKSWIMPFGWFIASLKSV